MLPRQLITKLIAKFLVVIKISIKYRETKVESLGQLVANMRDEHNMSLHNNEYLRRRELVTNQVRRFAELDNSTQKTRLIR